MPPPLNCLLFHVPCSVRRLTSAGTESPSTVIRIVSNTRGLQIDLRVGGGRGHNTSMPAPTTRLHHHPHTALHLTGICSSFKHLSRGRTLLFIAYYEPSVETSSSAIVLGVSPCSNMQRKYRCDPTLPHPAQSYTHKHQETTT